MANGRVLTGYSKPIIAKYSAAAGTVTYSGAIPLARGVSVNISVQASDGTKFYADNHSAEESGSIFNGGTATLTVDGLKEEARKLAMGLGDEETITVGSRQVKAQVDNDDQKAPYVGIGFIMRYEEEGVESFVPVILHKAVFNPDGLSAQTQGENKSYQTQELTATLMRDDTSKHGWRKICDEQSTEKEAEEVIYAVFNKTA